MFIPLLGGVVALVLGNVLFKRFVHIRVLPRPYLGLLERWYASQPQRRRVAGAFVGWKLDLNATQRLVNEKQVQFKLLRCRIAAKANATPVWEEETTPAKTIPVESVEGNESWELCMAHLLSENPESIEPLVRIAVNERENYLIVRMDHVLTDGQGFARFMESLCESTSDFDAVEELPPVPESSINFDLSFAGLMKRLLGGVKPGYVGPLIENIAGNESLARTQVRGFVINPETMQSLHEKCRAKQTTITALMAAVAAHNLSMLAPNNNQPVTCHLQIPVSLRGNNKVFGGNFVAPFEMNLMVNEVGVWSNAVEVRQQLCKELPTIQQGVGMLVLVKDFRAYQLEKQNKFAEKRGRTATIEVSNLGKRSSSCWFFAQANHYVGPLFALNLVTCNGAMHCTVTTSSNAVSVKAMESFCSTLVSQINNLK